MKAEQQKRTRSMSGGNLVNKHNGSGYLRQLTDPIWRPLIKSPARSSLAVFFFLSVLVGAILSTRLLDSSPIVTNVRQQELSTGETVSTYTDSHDTTPEVGNNRDSHNTAPEVGKDTDSPDTTPEVGNNADSHNTATKDGSYKDSDKDTTEVGHNTDPADKTTEIPESSSTKIEFPLMCSETHTCPRNYPVNVEVDPDASPPPTCPEYFRWIYEDLKPWRETGITKEIVESARKTANFRLVILNGKAYVEKYSGTYQTRDVFTLWGMLQLLRKYPGRVPDLELMFDCVDWPVISKFHPWPNGSVPPLFRYCGDDRTHDIVFPDWSFWGWAEIFIKPWEAMSKDIREGNKRVRFLDREPYAYWKGNPFVAPHRLDLLKCNVSDEQDWGAHIFIQDWGKEAQQGFKQSNLADQCTDRYKIYIEGSAWSVSEKYILACDSVTLIMKPKYYDFFSRGLMPLQHYWPIKMDDKCRSIKFAVDWGNKHKQKAQAIGKAASDYIHEDVKMDYVYDYMLHLLTEYSKLFKYKPTIPKNAVEVCSESMACPAVESQKMFMIESMVKRPKDTPPCTMPPPYDRVELASVVRRKSNTVKQVENWERDYWNNQFKQK